MVVLFRNQAVFFWRRSEAVVTRRTRNAFIGSSRYEGSNPSVSALKAPYLRGFFFIVLHFVLHSIKILIDHMIHLNAFFLERMGVDFLHDRICLSPTSFHCILFRDIQHGHN